MQSNIGPAIKESGLKPIFTPCALLKKGVANYNLKKLIMLPDSELEKTLILLMSLFKIAYTRRFIEEKIILVNGGIGIYLNLILKTKS